MLRNVEKKYVDDVVSMMKSLLEAGCQEQIKEAIDEGLNYIEHEFDWDLWAKANIKMLPDGTPEKSANGRFILEDFKVDGSALRFIAFCLQEGELRLGRGFLNDENRDRYYRDTPRLYVKNERCPKELFDIEMSEWREYIKNKYHIMPPKLGDGFRELLKRDVVVTGGIAIADSSEQAKHLAGQTDREDSPASDAIEGLGFSTRTFNGLQKYGINTTAKLIRCYKAGLLLHIRNLGRGSLKEIEERLADFGVPKAHQPYPKERLSNCKTRDLINEALQDENNE